MVVQLTVGRRESQIRVSQYKLKLPYKQEHQKDEQKTNLQKVCQLVMPKQCQEEERSQSNLLLLPEQFCGPNFNVESVMYFTKMQ